MVSTGCFAANVGGCGGRLSLEHSLSFSLLREMGDELEVSGFPWLPAGTTKRVAARSLGSKVLCETHNRHLANLDSAAATFFRCLRACIRHDGRGSVGTVQGELVEQWMLKCLLGFDAARHVVVEGQRRTFALATQFDLLSKLFDGHRWTDGRGLYSASKSQSPISTSNSLSFGPLWDTTLDRCSGCVLSFSGIPFILQIGDPEYHDWHLANWHYRPDFVEFDHGGVKSGVNIQWAEPTGMGIVIRTVEDRQTPPH